jgi:hypothetical protein
VGTNPAFDAPGAMGFGEKLAKACRGGRDLEHGPTETGEALDVGAERGALPRGWGDTRAPDGTIAPVQPMIAPLYEPAMSDIEFLAMLAGDERGRVRARPVGVGGRPALRDE